ncbi:MAG: hypothetical protein ABIV06_12990 [Thermoanaerobaculia bacterium]
MRGLKLVVFLLSLLALSSQLIRHAYVRWIENRDSVLFKYEPPEKNEIRDAKSLAELEARYAKEYERARLDAAKEPHAEALEGEGAVVRQEPAESARYDPKVMDLGRAIQEWERLDNEVAELKFYWFCGLGALVLAGVAFGSRWLWPALALTILGFSEMIWATSPSFSGDADHQFVRLLSAKIEYSVFSLVLLAVFWALGWLRAPGDQAASTR